MLIGCHVSISGSLPLAVDRALAIGATTFQIFTTNPRGWAAKPIPTSESKLFIYKKHEAGFTKIFSHMPYLPNLASPKQEVYIKSVNVLIEEIKRCSQLEIPFLVTHLGSHLGNGIKYGIHRIKDAINTALNETPGLNVKILLENTSGRGNMVGTKFDEIAEIIDGVDNKHQIGFCLDTCHAFTAGYDLKSEKGVFNTYREIKDTIGLNKLSLIHLNDSKGKKGSNIDRHQHIGLGKIGVDGFYNIFKQFGQSFPIILETPVDNVRGDKENIAAAKLISEAAFKGESINELKKKLVLLTGENTFLENFF
ncbi:MAG: deoxyribonuclease IV [Candidatus Odinarchaeia archaeon]